MPEVQKEIELTDDQKAELGKLRNEIRDQIRNQMQDSFNGMRDLSDEERQARIDKIREQMDTIRKDVEGKLQKVLLPNQFDRLKQIDLQSRIQREGAGALSQGELADQLGLTDDQKEKLQQKSEEVQKDLQAKIRQLRLDARKPVARRADGRAEGEARNADGHAIRFAGAEFQSERPAIRQSRRTPRSGRSRRTRRARRRQHDSGDAPASGKQRELARSLLIRRVAVHNDRVPNRSNRHRTFMEAGAILVKRGLLSSQQLDQLRRDRPEAIAAGHRRGRLGW